MMSMVRSLLFLLDKMLYGLINIFYEVFIKLSAHQLFSDTYIDQVSSRVYALIGILAVFMIGFKLLQSIANPSKLTEEKGGVAGMPMRILKMLVLIIIVPIGFSVAYDIQGIIIGYTEVLDDDKEPTGEYTYNASDNIIFRIVLGEDFEPTINLGESIYFSLTTVSDPKNSEVASYFAAIESGELSDIKDEALDAKDGDEYIFSWYYLVTLLVAFGVLIILGMSAVELAIRLIKLGLLEMFAPIFIVALIQDSDKFSFDNWLKTVIKTFTYLFIRVLVLSLVIFIAIGIGEMINVYSSCVTATKATAQTACSAAKSELLLQLIPLPDFDGTATEWAISLLSNLFLLIGAFIFMGKSVAFFEAVTGVKLESNVSIKDGLKVAAGVAMGGAGLALGAGALGLGVAGKTGGYIGKKTLSEQKRKEISDKAKELSNNIASGVGAAGNFVQNKGAQIGKYSGFNAGMAAYKADGLGKAAKAGLGAAAGGGLGASIGSAINAATMKKDQQVKANIAAKIKTELTVESQNISSQKKAINNINNDIKYNIDTADTFKDEANKYLVNNPNESNRFDEFRQSETAMLEALRDNKGVSNSAIEKMKSELDHSYALMMNEPGAEASGAKRAAEMLSSATEAREKAVKIEYRSNGGTATSVMGGLKQQEKELTRLEDVKKDKEEILKAKYEPKDKK